ncbi:glycoside hydrolase family 16 protein [Pseudonocardia sp. GCM10023141]|uniref:glycoside hydrolase family 16 protein n=1 Tax=Pseudonocardia sp. GCM10023141 TaxID=3252653 RepID=UPI00360F6201
MAGPPSTEEPPRRTSGRTILLSVGAVVVLAVVATVVVLTTRSSTPSTGGTTTGGGTSTATGSAGADTSAAKLMGWGEPNRVDEFDGSKLERPWRPYDGEGHGGNGRRSPSAITVHDGMLTITGDDQATTGGLAWGKGQMYGRWEGRVRAPASDPTYHALLLLWPDAEDWPVGGEIDFMELTEPTRQEGNFFLHYADDDKQDQKVQGTLNVDATQWHNWAIEWTPDHVVAYLDGKEWFRNNDKDKLPPRPMHLTVQLDFFPEDNTTSVRQSTMDVDWVKQYPVSS